eukprot:223421-Pelagomonas_calceolata.AAC.1
MDRLMSGLHDTHRLIHATHIATGDVGKPGFGVAVLATVQCADFLHEDVKLGALYINPGSQRFPVRAVTDSFSSLLDEVAR